MGSHDYTIIEVLRPRYERIYDRDKVKVMNKQEVISEYQRTI